MSHFTPNSPEAQFMLEEASKTEQAIRAPHLLHCCKVLLMRAPSRVAGKWMCCDSQIAPQIQGLGDTPQAAAAEYDRVWREGLQ